VGVTSKCDTEDKKMFEMKINRSENRRIRHRWREKLWVIKIDFDAISLLAVHVYLPRMILRPAPMFCPACEAPLF
jgi:hypothetical protein